MLTLFINKADSSRDLAIFMISLIASFKILNVVIHDPNIFFWIAPFVADAPVVNPKGIKTLLANGLSVIFSVKTNQFLVIALKVYLKIIVIVQFYTIEFLII